MDGATESIATLRIGRWRGVEVRLHILFPLIFLVALAAVAVAWPGSQLEIASAWSSREVVACMVVWLVSVACHEVVKALAAHRVGGHTPLIVLAPWGSGAHSQLPPDPPAYLVTAVAGPVCYLGLALCAGCLLIALGQDNLIELLRPMHPRFTPADSALQLTLQLALWINVSLLIINMLPALPFDAADVIHGLLWPLLGRASATAAISHVAYVASVTAALLALAFQREPAGGLIPAWLPLAATSVLLLYGAQAASRQRRRHMASDFVMQELDDDVWTAVEWLEDERAAVVAQHLEEKQQEALDRKRRLRENREDARVDDILARINELGLDKISEEERAILKRASRRYQLRRNGEPNM